MKPVEYLKKPYHRIIIPCWSHGRPNGYFAMMQEFPGCMTQGETVEEAYWNLESAAESWIEVMLEDGQAIPEPEDKP